MHIHVWVIGPGQIFDACQCGATRFTRAAANLYRYN